MREQGEVNLSESEMETVRDKIMTDLKEHEGESRRSVSIGTHYYSKLATLSAGSLALIATVGTAIITRPNGSPHIQCIPSRWLVSTAVIFLWVSLLSSVIHNWMAVKLSQYDASISENQFQSQIITHSLKAIEPHVGSEATKSAQKAIDDARYDKTEQVRRQVFRRERLKSTIVSVGYLAVATFVIPYTLIALCIVIYLR